jgi:acyl-CoA carboxylase epsilon subunit-like protein
VSAPVSVGSISGNPTPEEVVAVTVAVTALVDQQLQAGGAVEEPARHDWLSVWVEASRRSAQRSTLQRGPWRISGRIARRSRV